MNYIRQIIRVTVGKFKIMLEVHKDFKIILINKVKNYIKNNNNVVIMRREIVIKYMRKITKHRKNKNTTRIVSTKKYKLLKKQNN